MWGWDWDSTFMIIFEEDGGYFFPMYWISEPVAINDFSHDYLTSTRREVVEILKTFAIMSSHEIVELGSRDD